MNLNSRLLSRKSLLRQSESASYIILREI